MGEFTPYPEGPRLPPPTWIGALVLLAFSITMGLLAAWRFGQC